MYHTSENGVIKDTPQQTLHHAMAYLEFLNILLRFNESENLLC